MPPPAREPGDAVRVFIILTLTMACAGFVYAGLTNTMPKMFEIGLGDGLATSYTQIGLLVGVVSGTASAAGILGGWLADRFSARSIYVVFWMLQVPLLFVIATTTGATLLLVALLTLSFNLSFTAAENMLVAQYTPTRWRSLAYGAKFVLALGVAGLTVILAGWVFDSTGGFDLLFVWLGTAAIVAAITGALLPGTAAQTRPRTCRSRLSGNAGPQTSSASSLILRVRVFRPQPSSLAASWRRPPVRPSAHLMSTVSNLGIASSSNAPLPRPSRRSAQRRNDASQSCAVSPASAVARSSGGRSSRWISLPDAMTVSQRQAFSSCRTLPGQSSVSR